MMMIEEFAFLYPEPRKSRRHGPVYKNYESYRPWLRDEFMFRCIYCLKRETWGQASGEFELDHFKPQKFNPDKKLDYKNLVYSCQRCNSAKSSNKIIAVGTVVADRPPHRSVREALPHTAPPSGLSLIHI